MPQPSVFNTATATYRRIEAWQGEGGCAYVFKVADSEGTVFALKMLKPDHREKVKEKRFKNEIGFLRELRSPDIVPLVDYGTVECDGKLLPFFVMPFYPLTLRDLLTGTEPPGKRDPIRALRLFDSLLSGVGTLHLKGHVHRDLKPENVLHDLGNDRLVLADFGIARLAEDALFTEVRTESGERLASWRYAAPEQKEGKEATASSDVFSLGLILGEMFTGVVLEGRGAPTIASMAPAVAYLDDLLDLMLRQDPSARPPSINAVKGEILARGNEFVHLQRLSKLDQTVVPTGAPDDAYSVDPVRFVSAEVAPVKSSIRTRTEWPQVLELAITLSRPVDEKWVHVLQTSSLGYTSGYPPKAFAFDGSRASLSLMRGDDAPHVVLLFKGWLEAMKTEYRRVVEAEARETEVRERAELETKKAREEELLRLNRALRGV